MKIDVTALYRHQAELDQHIQSKHGVDYPSTRDKRLLALFVELGELANETRCFKFWSLKPRSEKSIILDEYADGVHFLLSLGIEVKSLKKVYEITEKPLDEVKAFLACYAAIDAFKASFNVANFENAFQAYLNLIPALGYTAEETIVAYKKKLEVNYQRQQNKY